MRLFSIHFTTDVSQFKHKQGIWNDVRRIACASGKQKSSNRWIRPRPV